MSRITTELPSGNCYVGAIVAADLISYAFHLSIIVYYNVTKAMSHPKYYHILTHPDITITVPIYPTKPELGLMCESRLLIQARK